MWNEVDIAGIRRFFDSKHGSIYKTKLNPGKEAQEEADIMGTIKRPKNRPLKQKNDIQQGVKISGKPL